MNFKVKILSSTIVCLLGINAFDANAALVTLNISGSTNNVAGTATNSASDSSTTLMDASSEAYEDVSTSVARSRGDNTGWFYSTASGSGNFTTESIVTQTYNVTNDSSDDQFFDFSFEVMNGGIDANCGDYGYGYGDGYGYGYGSNGCSVDDFAEAGYMAEILLNGSSIWNSEALVTADVNGFSLTSSGATFANVYSGANYLSWATTLFNIDLGLVAANESFTLEYVVKTFVEGAILDGFSTYNRAYAQFGDPNGFSSTNNSFVARTADVPAPEALLLLGLGLAGIGYSRKRIK
jgi:hypothetical protein